MVIYLKAQVDRSGCIGCGACVGTCPEVFRLDNEGLSQAYQAVTEETKATAIEARDNCPVSVISLED